MTEKQNERRYPRVKVPKNALVAWKNGSQKFVSPVENLALGGLFIRTKDPLSSGTMLQLVFNTPQGQVRVRAVVRNVKAGEGMGVAIVAREPGESGRWDRDVRKLTARDATAEAPG